MHVYLICSSLTFHGYLLCSHLYLQLTASTYVAWIPPLCSPVSVAHYFCLCFMNTTSVLTCFCSSLLLLMFHKYHLCAHLYLQRTTSAYVSWIPPLCSPESEAHYSCLCFMNTFSVFPCICSSLLMLMFYEYHLCTHLYLQLTTSAYVSWIPPLYSPVSLDQYRTPSYILWKPPLCSSVSATGFFFLFCMNIFSVLAFFCSS
jgi:hypothetical protein